VVFVGWQVPLFLVNGEKICWVFQGGFFFGGGGVWLVDWFGLVRFFSVRFGSVRFGGVKGVWCGVVCGVCVVG
jgi:hypothetical protein